jgi:hypothetical protein
MQQQVWLLLLLQQLLQRLVKLSQPQAALVCRQESLRELSLVTALPLTLPTREHGAALGS